jgi:hypothetical protein
LLGRSERGARANSGGGKRFIAEVRNSNGPHLTGEVKENTILVLVGKILGGPKNNQLLNATVA